jgi:hypothetical protein
MPQRLGMLCVQIDFILCAIQPEKDGACSFAAIKVIDKHGLYLLGQSYSISLADLLHSLDQSKLRRA